MVEKSIRELIYDARLFEEEGLGRESNRAAYRGYMREVQGVVFWLARVLLNVWNPRNVLMS